MPALWKAAWACRCNSICIEALEKVSDKTLMNGLGELTDGEMKKFAKTKLRKEAIALLNFFKAYPTLT